MAASSSNSESFIVEVGEEFPYPSHVIAPYFFTVKLSGKDKYDVWKTQMLCLLRSHGMLGFIDDQTYGKRILVEDMKNAWMRSDSLVTGWILGSLSEEVAMEVVNCLTSKHNNTDFTAKDAWDELQRSYGPSSVATDFNRATRDYSEYFNFEYFNLKVRYSISTLINHESSRQLSNPNHPSIGSICMVPDTIRNVNPGAYTPRIISIGPLHKEDQRLRAMEEIKVTYMYRLLCETKEESTYRTIDTWVEEVCKRIGQARACYGPSFTYYDDVQLAEMMVIDGCFILELLYRFQLGMTAGDRIFDNNWVKHGVTYDLLLLENQIPFFILEALFQLTVKRILRFNDLSLTNLILRFFKDPMNILNNTELTLEYGPLLEHCHILGLLQSCYRPGGTNGGGVPTFRYSATEIAGAGVIFKPQVQRNSDSLLAVQFLQSFVPGFGKLFIREASFKIPVLRIEDSTSSFLRNLIAYEQCYSSSRPYVTSFAFLMDMLIDTNDDVSLLVRAKVLQHNLGACEDVTNLFNNICNGVVRRDFYYSDEWTKLDDYRRRFWPRILISLRRLYTSTTWKTLAVIGAVAIFVLTLIQTIYAVRNA